MQIVSNSLHVCPAAWLGPSAVAMDTGRLNWLVVRSASGGCLRLDEKAHSTLQLIVFACLELEKNLILFYPTCYLLLRLTCASRSAILNDIYQSKFICV